MCPAPLHLRATATSSPVGTLFAVVGTIPRLSIPMIRVRGGAGSARFSNYLGVAVRLVKHNNSSVVNYTVIGQGLGEGQWVG